MPITETGLTAETKETIQTKNIAKATKTAVWTVKIIYGAVGAFFALVISGTFCGLYYQQMNNFLPLTNICIVSNGLATVDVFP